jgi:hypothetical protein
VEVVPSPKSHAYEMGLVPPVVVAVKFTASGAMPDVGEPDTDIESGAGLGTAVGVGAGVAGGAGVVTGAGGAGAGVGATAG